MSHGSPSSTGPEPATWVLGVTALGALGFLGFGLWALLAPQSFFESLAAFEPYNQHFIHDIGAFQVGLGAVLALLAVPSVRDGLSAGLLGVGIGALVHVGAHVVDRDLGGSPTTDIPALLVLALLLLAAGAARLRQVRSAPA